MRASCDSLNDPPAHIVVACAPPRSNATMPELSEIIAMVIFILVNVVSVGGLRTRVKRMGVQKRRTKQTKKTKVKDMAIRSLTVNNGERWQASIEALSHCGSLHIVDATIDKKEKMLHIWLQSPGGVRYCSLPTVRVRASSSMLPRARSRLAPGA